MKMKIAVTLGVVLAVTVLFTACLTEIAEETVTVTFDSLGGTEVDSVVLTRGETLGARFVVPTRGDDEFLGWFLNFDRFTADTVINVNLELSARWRSYDFHVDTIPVTFYAPGAIPPITVLNVEIGNALGPIFPVDPRQRGYWFGGWEVNGIPFTNESIVTEAITATPTWSPRDMLRVVLWVPEVHRPTAENPDLNYGVSQRYFMVYEGEAIMDIPNWEDIFPAVLDIAADPSDYQFHQFFRWAAGAGVYGLVVDQYTVMTRDMANTIMLTGRTPGTPITAAPNAPNRGEVPFAERAELDIGEDDILLGGFFGMFFHPASFDVDLSTFGMLTPGFGATRNPLNNAPNQSFDDATGIFSVTVNDFNAQFWFQTPPDLRPLLNYVVYGNLTQFLFEVDYEYVGDFCECAADSVCGRRPHPNNPNNHTNVMIGNIRVGSNWNATEVRDLTLSEITNGIWSEMTGEYEPAIHNVVATHASNAGANRNWIYFRAGRGGCVGDNDAFDLNIRSIRIHLLQ
ncbi:MAG: InlB B-repeat-containing protein [Treponema sp.]|nr:InlB B-repeat-containing protein [Treponema sp.]